MHILPPALPQALVNLTALVPEPPQVLSMPAVDVVPSTSVEGVPSTSMDPGITEGPRTSPSCSPQSTSTDSQVGRRRTARVGARQHPNPHRLPRAVGAVEEILPSQTL